MAKVQAFVFENESPVDHGTNGLMLTPQPDRPLTKAQRTFNRLLARIEELRARIAKEAQILDDALAYYGVHLHPGCSGRINCARILSVRSRLF